MLRERGTIIGPLDSGSLAHAPSTSRPAWPRGGRVTCSLAFGRADRRHDGPVLPAGRSAGAGPAGRATRRDRQLIVVRPPHAGWRGERQGYVTTTHGAQPQRYAAMMLAPLEH